MKHLNLSAEDARGLKDCDGLDLHQVMDRIEDATLSGYANIFLEEGEHLGRPLREELLCRGFYIKLHGASHKRIPKWEIAWVEPEEKPLPPQSDFY